LSIRLDKSRHHFRSLRTRFIVFDFGFSFIKKKSDTQNFCPILHLVKHKKSAIALFSARTQASRLLAQSPKAKKPKQKSKTTVTSSHCTASVGSQVPIVVYYYLQATTPSLLFQTPPRVQGRYLVPSSSPIPCLLFFPATTHARHGLFPFLQAEPFWL
jgi:hypothetical protein